MLDSQSNWILMGILWIFVGIAAVVVYLNHKAHRSEPKHHNSNINT
ncbi:MAG: hypothetical protein OEW08_12460 [Gammaproteobacteria bacterium]|nr:hypothetical protein [Gammaproteobacteria bacterium]